MKRFSILWRISCGATNAWRSCVVATLGFSILWRISCGATYDLAAAVSEYRRFSILWRISCGATTAAIVHMFYERLFQYSLANLVWCNGPPPGEVGLPLLCFSILWRISCGATLHQRQSGCAAAGFSILWRISCGATSIIFITVGLAARFSILWRISCGATFYGRCMTKNWSEFQYSLANLVWCNIERAMQSTQIRLVSVFSGESRVVQPLPQCRFIYNGF